MTSTQRVAALFLGLPLLGCVAMQTTAPRRAACGPLASGQRDLVARRATLRAEMLRDVDLGRHGGEPGRSFDERSNLDADAYVTRVEVAWRSADAGVADAMFATDRRLRSAGCRSGGAE